MRVADMVMTVEETLRKASAPQLFARTRRAAVWLQCGRIPPFRDGNEPILSRPDQDQA